MIVPDTRFYFILIICRGMLTVLLPTPLMVIRLPVADLDPRVKQSCSGRDCEVPMSLKIRIDIFLVESSTMKICSLDINGRYSLATSLADTTYVLFSARTLGSLFCRVQRFAALCPVFRQ